MAQLTSLTSLACPLTGQFKVIGNKMVVRGQTMEDKKEDNKIIKP